MDEEAPRSRSRLVCALLLIAAVAWFLWWPTRSLSWGTAKVFCIGPGHTGTHTLFELFRRESLRACHHHCSGMSWSDASLQHDLGPLQQYDAFMDGGDRADWRWLEKKFAGRFVLNTRPLVSYLLSKKDHKRRKHNASIHVVEETCKQAAHQAEVRSYFRKNRERRGRFAIVDVSNDPGVIWVLRWVGRNNLDEFRTQRIVTGSWDLPRPLRSLPGRSPVLYKAPTHSSRRHIEGALRKAGCPAPFWNDTIYKRCAAAMGCSFYVSCAGVGRGSSRRRLCRCRRHSPRPRAFVAL